MNPTMTLTTAQSALPEYGNPPVVETVVGVQFQSLSGFTNAHLGAFWQALGVQDWPTVQDVPPLPRQEERFTPEAQWGKVLRLQRSQNPASRLQIRNRDGNRMARWRFAILVAKRMGMDSAWRAWWFSWRWHTVQRTRRVLGRQNSVGQSEGHEATLHGRRHRPCFAARCRELVRQDDPERLVVDGCARNDPRAFISRRVGDARTDHQPGHEGDATRVDATLVSRKALAVC